MDQDKVEKLKQLSELYKSGILTKEELEAEMKKVLGDKTKDEKNKNEGYSPSQRVANQKSQRKQTTFTDKSYGDNPNRKLAPINKKIIYFIAVIIILIGIGVFIGLYQHHQNQIALAKEREQARLDSIAEVERLLEIHRQDSIRHDAEIREFTSPDLALYGLHGRVKSLKIIQGFDFSPEPFSSHLVSFTYDGVLNDNNIIKDFVKKNYDMDPSTLKIKKNKSGFITHISDGMDWEHLDLNWKENKLISYKEGGGDCEIRITYNYIDNLVSGYKSESSCIGYLGILNCQYSNFEFDRYDNWIKCDYHQTGYNNEYDYDGDEYEEEKLIKHETLKPKTGVIIREIEYYD